MRNVIKAEFIKERRGANVKLVLIVPFIFVFFNVLMGMLMGPSPEGKSYLMATSFNWYPIMVLPVVLSLLVVNSNNKEKDKHLVFQKSMGLSGAKIILAKNIVILLELLVMLVMSSMAIFVFGSLILREPIVAEVLVAATVVMFVGSLPVIGLSFLVSRFCKKSFFIIIMNFVLTLPSAIIAVTDKWPFFPWSYNLRMLAPIVGVNPNGTFLELSSPLWDLTPVYLGLLLSILVYILSLVGLIAVDRWKKND
ncbi:ABC transporter permease [Granulicatella seriolae]|uniref:ABC transporter permease n=1 Tax=Granulicatella seriolae TaxID=2967226 RepID=A0ABT1WQ05_9LACT|nr:ABC transporter permease [Granulicatella seriolae]